MTPDAPTPRSFRRLPFALLALAAVTCSDDTGQPPGGRVNGTVYMSEPVRGAAVDVVRFDGGQAGATICSTITDDAGAYACDLGKLYGDLIVVATGGTTTENGAALTLPAGATLRAPALGVAVGEQHTTQVNPASDLVLAVGLARTAANKDGGFAASVARAHALVREHLEVDPVAIAPAALDATTTLTEPVKLALFLRGLGTLAATIAAEQSLTAVALNSRTLHDRVIDDASSAEAQLDGVGKAGGNALTLGPSCALPMGCTTEGAPMCVALCWVETNTLRARVAAGALAFLRSPANHTGLTREDALPWATHLQNNASELFGSTQGPEGLDSAAPVVSWNTPAADQVFGAGQAISVDVTATDALGVASLVVVVDLPTPIAIADTDPAPEHFQGTLALTGLPEGPLPLLATAIDIDGNDTPSPRSVVVDQVAGGTVSGSAYKARLANAPVAIYTFTGGTRGATPVGTGTTQPDGSFTNVLVAENTRGPLLVEVGGGGTYAEDSQPATVVTLDVNDVLRTIIPAFTDGGATSGVVVSPATELAVSYFTWLNNAGTGGADLAARWATAHGALEAMLGIASVTTVQPSDPAQIDTLTAADRYGLVLLGISRTAWAASTSGGGDAGAFGPTINAQKVTNLWSRDIRDGCLDGKAGATPLSYGGVGTLTDEATRLQLAQAIVAYLGDGARNVTAFTTPAEVLPLLDTLAQGGGNAAPGSCTGAVAGHLFDDNGRSFDRDGPLVAFDGGTPPAGAFVRGSIMVDATATDVGMLDPSPTLRIVTPAGTVDTDGDTNDRDIHATFDTATAVPGGGPLTVVLDGFDHSGNHSDVVMSTRTFTVDNTPPVVTITAPAMDGQFLRPPVTIQYTVTETNVMTTTALLDGMTSITPGFQVAMDGPHNVSVSVVDRAGNTASATRTFTIDNIAPVLSVTAPAAGSYVRGPVTLSWSVSDANPGTVATATLDTMPITSPHTFNAEGSHTLVVNATDAAGNVAATVTRTFTIDNTPPVITATAISGFVRGPVTLTFSATDNSPPATVTATLNTVPFSSGGQVNTERDHALVVNAVDQAGNAAVTVTRNFTVDNTGPVITSVVSPSGTIVQPPLTITATATDNFMASGSLPSNLVLTGTPSPASTTPSSMGGNRTLAALYTAPADGPLTARFNITDAAGNPATEHVVTRTIDNTDPVPTITGVTAGAWYAAAVTIAFGQTDANPGTTTATLDSMPFASGGQAATEGAHSLVVTATDAASNVATTTVPFVVDLNSPTLALVTAAPPAWVRGTLAFQVIADDTLKGIGSLNSDVIVTVNGPSGAVATTPSFTTLADGRRRVDVSIDTTVVDDAAGTGSLTVRFDVTDRSGRTATPLTLTRSMDNAAPVVSFTGFPYGTATSGWSNASAPALVIGGAITDASPATVTLSIDAAAPATATVGAGAWNHAPPTTLAEGSHLLTALATDAAGNTTTATYTLNIDRTGPAANNTPRAVYDESNDVITYNAANRPQHQHQGTQVMLGGATCQNIYKHAYLLDMAPAGDEVPANPLAFDWRANDGAGVGVNTGSLRYTVTAPSGSTTGAFVLSPTMAGADVLATATLLRNAVPALGVVGMTEEGTFSIAFSVSDRLGNATTISRCWTHQPIGAPVQVTSSGVIAAGAVGVSLDALNEFKLGENDALSPLFNNTHPGAGLMRIDLRNRTSDRVWFTFAPTISAATYTKTWNVKYQAISTAASTTACQYDSANATIRPPAAVCVNDGEYTGTLPGESVTTAAAFAPTPTVRLFDMTVVSNPVEVTVCPTCEPLEFELTPGIAYTAVVAIKHLQPLGFTGITSGYLEGNTGVSPGPIVSTTRLPIAPLSMTGDGINKYCSAYTILSGTSARCNQTTTVGGVRWAAALGLSGSATSTAASAAGSQLTYKRTGPSVMNVNTVNASWMTIESPIP